MELALKATSPDLALHNQRLSIPISISYPKSIGLAARAQEHEKVKDKKVQNKNADRMDGWCTFVLKEVTVQGVNAVRRRSEK
jgi:hypothetical protein